MIEVGLSGEDLLYRIKGSKQERSERAGSSQLQGECLVRGGRPWEQQASGRNPRGSAIGSSTGEDESENKTPFQANGRILTAAGSPRSSPRGFRMRNTRSARAGGSSHF